MEVPQKREIGCLGRKRGTSDLRSRDVRFFYYMINLRRCDVVKDEMYHLYLLYEKKLPHFGLAQRRKYGKDGCRPKVFWFLSAFLF